MKYDQIQSYEDAIKYLKKSKRKKHLLLGNGFSMAYDHTIFSYNALYEFIENLDNELLSKLFNIINTKNFELVMQQLDNFLELAKVFSTDKELVSKLENASDELKTSLIDAIEKLHPEHVFEMPEEKSVKCFNFLSSFIDNEGKIFTTNYDLLMYWVLIRNQSQNAIDGFGREVENPDAYKTGDDFEWSDLHWGKNREKQSVFYVHGALPIFDTGVEILKEVYTEADGNYLLQNIKKRMDNKDYPVFVTAGNGRQKLEHIMHNRYLTDCYENLSKIQGSLITFGFNFGEYDEHIIDAVNRAAKQGKKQPDKLWSIYIGVYSESDFDYIQSIKDKFRCKVNVFDSKTASIWE